MKRKKKPWHPEFRDCLHCGDTFEVERERASAKTCSQECSREWRKVQQRTFHANNLRANGEAINARRRNNYAEKPDPILERNAEWERKNRLAINAGRRDLYAAKKGAPVRAWRRREVAHAER